MTKKIAVIALFALLLAAASAFGQTALTQTTLSAAAGSGGDIVTVASATGITANQTVLFVDSEAMFVISLNATRVRVFRGYAGTPVASHVSGARVLLGPPAAFAPVTTGVNADGDPTGSCTAANTQYTPFVNIKNGNQWLCSTVTLTWVPGWGNNSRPPAPTTLVASAAGVILPSGPLFHVNGTAAITGFTIPVGFPVKSGASLCVIPDAIFTTTAAGNIALASTAVVNKLLCWAYDTANAKFVPTY